MKNSSRPGVIARRSPPLSGPSGTAPAPTGMFALRDPPRAIARSYPARAGRQAARLRRRAAAGSAPPRRRLWRTNSYEPMNGPIPPSTATATPRRRSMTRRRTAAMHASDIAIQPRPCAIPKIASSGCRPGTSQTTSSTV